MDTVGAIFPAIFYHDFGVMFSNHFINHFSEETDHAVFRQITGADDL